MVDVDELAAMLVRAARERRTLSYGAILSAFGKPAGSRMASALMADLGAACARLAERGSPDAACIVVRKADGLPGAGYFAALRARGAYSGPSEGAEARAYVTKRQSMLFDFWSDDADLPAEIADFLRD